MAGVSVTVRDDRVGAALERLSHAVGNLEPALDEIGNFAVSQILAGFDGERDPYNVPWQASDRAITEGGKTLQDQGHLRDSYTHLVEGDSVFVGSNIVYARAHQFGREEINLPPRKMLPLTDDGEVDLPPHWIDEIEGTLGDHLLGALNA